MEREALKLALEALEVYWGKAEHRRTKEDESKAIKAITAIKEALEQPPLQVQPQQQPLGWIASMALNDLRCGIFRAVTIYGAELDETIPIYTTPPKRPWVDLTDAQMMEITNKANTHSETMQMTQAKLKELNHG